MKMESKWRCRVRGQVSRFYIRVACIEFSGSATSGLNLHLHSHPPHHLPRTSKQSSLSLSIVISMTVFLFISNLFSSSRYTRTASRIIPGLLIIRTPQSCIAFYFYFFAFFAVVTRPRACSTLRTRTSPCPECCRENY